MSLTGILISMDDELALIREKRKQELMDQMKHSGKPGSVSDVSETNFPQFISTHPFVVVDFWAEWCGPCRRVAPVMDELAKEFAGKVVFGKCNTDENRHIAMEFNISAIPAIMLFRNGQLADRIIGAYPREAIREKIVRRFGLE